MRMSRGRHPEGRGRSRSSGRTARSSPCLRSSGQAIPTCAPSWPWPLITNGIRPARLRIHIRSSTARARATMPVHREEVGVGQADRRGKVRAALAGHRHGWTPRAAAPQKLIERPSTAMAASPTTSDERRVGVGRAADLPGRRVEGEGERRLGDEVGGVRADEVDAERVVGLRVGDDLGEALVLAADDRLGDRLEGHLADLVREALLLALLLGQADRGDLRAGSRSPAAAGRSRSGGRPCRRRSCGPRRGPRGRPCGRAAARRRCRRSRRGAARASASGRRP